MTNYNEPIYDPFGERGPTFYHPANDAAMHLIAIQLIYRDIEKLLKLRRQKDGYAKRLLLKYVIIEIVSVDTQIVSLANTIISGATGYKLESNKLAIAKELYKQYTDVREKNWDKLKIIRNKLGAHRDRLDLLTIAELWDNIDIKSMWQILEAIPPLFNFFKDLNVYCWTKADQDKSGNKIQAFIQPFDYSALIS